MLVRAGLGDELARGDLAAVRSWLSRQSDPVLLRVSGGRRPLLVRLRVWEHGLPVRRLSSVEVKALNRCASRRGDVGALVDQIYAIRTARLERDPLRRQQAKLERTAYHEAGHVVAAVKMGIRFTRATIVAEGNTLGAVHCEAMGFDPLEHDAVTDRMRLVIERRIVFAMAGREAESRFAREDPMLSRRDVREVRTGGDDDHWKVLLLMDCIAGSAEESEAYGRLLQVRTRAMLSALWPCVEAVAAALLERQTLTHTEALAAFRAGAVR